VNGSDTPSPRALFNQQIHGSKRSIRSVKDFSEFEQRTAYCNVYTNHAAKKGRIFISPEQATEMERVQVMFDFPPAPKLDMDGRLDRTKATRSELRGEKLFFGKAQCASCHPAPFYLDHQMHDLHLERFLKYEAGDGPIKSFTLRGIKDSPPYLHDGRCLAFHREHHRAFGSFELFHDVAGPAAEGRQRLDVACDVKHENAPGLRHLLRCYQDSASVVSFRQACVTAVERGC